MTSSSQTLGVKPIFGTASITTDNGYGSENPTATKDLLDVLTQHGCDTLDTAQLYGDSETLLGNAKASDSFVIDTKFIGGFGGGKGFEEPDVEGKVLKSVEESVRKLGGKVDVFYIHAPLTTVPLASQLAGINAGHKAGHFKRFGLSNFTAEQVREVYDICKEKGYVLPSVYQGNYSPIARKLETLLFPTLRSLNFSFYAYSPLAGGFLTKTRDQIASGAGRFDQSTFLGQMYGGLYAKPAYLDALAEWEDIAREEGVGRAELAYRWVGWNSALSGDKGDGVVVGARNGVQLGETLEGLKRGSLSERAAGRIERIWRNVEKEAPTDNWEFFKAMKGGS